MGGNYGYLNARVRGLRAQLLGEGFLAEAVELGGFDAFTSALGQSTYAADLEGARGAFEGLGMVDAAVAINVRRTTRSLLGWAKGDAKRLLAVLLMRYDVANLKAVARAFHAGRAGAEGREDAVEAVAVATLPAGELSANVLDDMARAADLPNAAQRLAIRGHPLADAFRRAVAAYAASGDLLSLEVALDLAYYRHGRETVRDANAPAPFERYLEAEIDGTNLTTAVKLRGREVGPEPFFVEGGRSLALSTYREIAAAEPGAALPALRPPFAALDEAADVGSVEASVRAVLDRFAKTLTTDPLDIGLVTHYLRSKEREAAQLRLIARGTYYGVPAATLRKELGHA